MTRLDCYIARHGVQGTLVWLSALVALFSFIVFINLGNFVDRDP